MITSASLTEAVTTALRERLHRVRAAEPRVKARADVLLAIGRDAARRLPEPVRTIDHGELLYDEDGRPR